MKNFKIYAFLSFLYLGSSSVLAQNQANGIKHPLSWEFQLGSNYLTNSNLSKNYPFQNANCVSGNFYTYVDFQIKSFTFRTGIGVASQNFGLNKMLVKNGDKTEFQNFNSNYNYRYSYFQKMFIEIPFGLTYATQYNKNHRCFEYEAGVKFGYLIYNESRYSVKNNNKEYSVFSENNLQQLNPFQFGTYVKFSSRKIQLNRILGTSFSISSQYNFSQVFNNDNYTPTYSYSFMLGMGLFINKTH